MAVPPYDMPDSDLTDEDLEYRRDQDEFLAAFRRQLGIDDPDTLADCGV